MATENHKLHIFFFPFLAYGHIIPTIDIAKLFAARSIKITIVTTPLNLPLFTRSLGAHESLSDIITIKTIPFPSAEATGLPEGNERADTISSLSLFPAFFKAIKLLQQPLEQLLLEDHPDCLISGSFIPWTIDSAAKFGIPRIVFHGMGSFALCALESLNRYKPYKNVLSDTDPFVIPNLPGKEIKITRMVLPDYERNEDIDYLRLSKAIRESEERSFGVIVNSFYELDGEYADHYKKVFGRKAWLIGPVSLCNRDIKEKACRGQKASIDEQEWLKWLDSKKPNSVVYVCFGSRSNFPEHQLKEIARGLEASGQNFIWVVRRSGKEDEEPQWLPEGFEKRMEGKGLIIKGWAPQMLILDHEAVGGFVTHCGWNSTIEALSAGVPMVTWPVSTEQFYNEKFVTEVLGTGVAVGVKKFEFMVGDSIKKEAIEKAVKEIMEGEEAEERRNRVRAIGKIARQAVEEGGSSYSCLDSLIEDLIKFTN